MAAVEPQVRPALPETHSPSIRDTGVSPLSIAQITLAHFRNYDDLRVDCSAAPVVVMGPNGSGKTNLIEAVSLLVPGRGLRRAPLVDLQNRYQPEPWAIAARVRSPAGILTIGTGKEAGRESGASEAESERRLVRIDGKAARGQNALAGYMAMAWITPEMDRLLADGASARRKFLDRLAYSFDPAHNARVQRYEKAMRERLRLLREGQADPRWLDALENEMAQMAVAIAAIRLDMIRRLRAAIALGGGAFPKADLAVRGTAENRLQDMPALLVEDGMRAAFATARGEDAQSGTCAVGAHRSDLQVIHHDKNCPADLCSTGEQKALLIAIILAYVRLLGEQRQMKPLFLLDDIAAHLDATRRAALFGEIRDLGVQAWLTGTDRDSFTALLPHAQSISVHPDRS